MQRETQVLAIGETMAMVAPTTPGGIDVDSRYAIRPGGAESNVALHLARLGHVVDWASPSTTGSPQPSSPVSVVTRRNNQRGET